MTVINIHASCVLLGDTGKVFGAPADAGVLLLGESGSGKSDLALRLIALGAQLVADDRVELFAADGLLMARAPESLAGLIEARGLGIVALPFAAQARIALAVELVAAPDVPRMPESQVYPAPQPLALPPSACPPLIRLCAFESAAPEKIGLAAAAFSKALFRDRRNP
jgi:serine kinase of HPr protein (carbohydrate metabolism regulator)